MLTGRPLYIKTYSEHRGVEWSVSCMLYCNGSLVMTLDTDQICNNNLALKNGS